MEENKFIDLLFYPVRNRQDDMPRRRPAMKCEPLTAKENADPTCLRREWTIDLQYGLQSIPEAEI